MVQRGAPNLGTAGDPPMQEWGERSGIINKIALDGVYVYCALVPPSDSLITTSEETSQKQYFFCLTILYGKKA